jgi:hypothetical protein
MPIVQNEANFEGSPLRHRGHRDDLGFMDRYDVGEIREKQTQSTDCGLRTEPQRNGRIVQNEPNFRPGRAARRDEGQMCKAKPSLGKLGHLVHLGMARGGAHRATTPRCPVSFRQRSQFRPSWPARAPHYSNIPSFQHFHRCRVGGGLGGRGTKGKCAKRTQFPALPRGCGAWVQLCETNPIGPPPRRNQRDRSCETKPIAEGVSSLKCQVLSWPGRAGRSIGPPASNSILPASHGSPDGGAHNSFSDKNLGIMAKSGFLLNIHVDKPWVDG